MAEDKDLNTSLLEAKRRLNAEIIQGIALDAVQREKKGRLVAEKETNQAREESLTDSGPVVRSQGRRGYPAPAIS